MGLGATPTAVLHLKAGTATANTAPLKFTAGTNLTTPEAGAIEFDGTHFYGTVGSTRHQFDQDGISSINSQTGPAITIQGGTGTSVSNSTNTVTVEVVPSSSALPHTLDAVYTTQGNTGTSETDLYSYTVPANKLGVDGRTVNFESDGEFNDNTIT
ncbi:MAG TPA: hypothetical protein VL943_09255, partial [Niabella sp.]|nr:hypothetical protein [Niabella sp.]